jgi:hypothetical protein
MQLGIYMLFVFRTNKTLRWNAMSPRSIFEGSYKF